MRKQRFIVSPKSKRHTYYHALLEQIFLACCAFADKGYTKFISVVLYLIYSGFTISTKA